MNSMNTNQNSKQHTIGLLEIQNFACKCEALFYELYLKTQDMVDAKKYLAGGDEELYKRSNLETTALLKTVADKCNKLAGELQEQYEYVTIDIDKKISDVVLVNNPEFQFVEVFY